MQYCTKALFLYTQCIYVQSMYKVCTVCKIYVQCHAVCIQYVKYVQYVPHPIAAMGTPVY